MLSPVDYTYRMGVDVSRWQGVMDWDKAASNGVTFAMLKATEADSVIDTQFARNYNECKRLGIPVGAYHFVRANVKPAKQFDRLVSVVGTLDLELGIALDCETTDKQPASVVTSIVIDLSGMLATRYGVRPMIYTSQGFGNANLLQWAGWTEHPLWVASWGANNPNLPRWWSDWDIWQFQVYQNGGYLGAKSSAIDLNWMRVETPDPPAEDTMNVTVEYQGKRWSGVLHA